MQSELIYKQMERDMVSKSTDDQTNLTEPVSEEQAIILDVEVED